MTRIHGYLLALLLALPTCTSPSAPAVIAGTWGGASVSLVLDAQGGDLTYLCGTGKIDAGWKLGSDGTFTATGEHFYGGGPLPVEGRTPHPATYVGHVGGDQMTLTVTVTDSETVLGPFELVKNGPQVSELCL